MGISLLILQMVKSSQYTITRSHNVEETFKFLEKYDITKEEIESLERFIAIIDLNLL